MELKDVNNALAGLLNFGKPSVSKDSAPVVGAGFADLLNSEPKVEAPVVKARDLKDRSRDDRKVRTDDKSVSNKNDSKNNAKRGDASSAEAPKVNSQKSRDNNIDKEAGTDKKIDTTFDQAVTDDASIPAEDEANTSEDLSASVIPLDVLALMGAINVINPQTGEITVTTGAELASQLAQNEGLMAVAVPETGDNATIQLVPVAPQNEVKSSIDGKLDVSGMDLVKDGETFNLNAANMAQTKKNDQSQAVVAPVAEDIVDEGLGEKVSKIADVLGNDQKLKVKVSVDEEKIAQLDAKSLVADAKAVDDAVSQSVNQTITTPKTGDGAQTKQAQGGINPVSINNFNAAPIINVTPVAQATENVTAPVSASSFEINSATLSNATATGSEFVKAAKAEVAADNTSFKDVYKGMSKEVADQVRVNITKSAVKGIDKIDITLKPEDLGRIEIKMQIGKDGKLQAHLVSSRPETMEALQKEMQSLEKAFNDAGFQTDEGSLSFSFRDGNQANQNQERENGLRNFIGDIFEREASSELLSGDAFQNQSWDGKSGLNIRV